MIQVWAGVEFKWIFRVFLHEDEQDYYEAKQTANIRQSLIDFFEPSLHNNSRACPSQDHAGKGLSVGRIGHNLSQITDNCSRLFSFLADGPNALISGNLVVGDEYADEVGSGGGGECKEVAVLEIVGEILRRVGVDESVEDEQVEVVYFIEDGSGVQADFGGIGCVAAFCDGDLSVLEKFWRKFALEWNVESQRRT